MRGIKSVLPALFVLITMLCISTQTVNAEALNKWTKYHTNSSSYTYEMTVQTGGGYVENICTTEWFGDPGPYWPGSSSVTTCVPGNYVPPTYETHTYEGTDYSRGDYIGIITAPPGTYPANGQGNDGYWYVLSADAPPSLTILSPDPGQIMGHPGTGLAVKISVSDPNGDELTSRYFLDGETIPRETSTITNTVTPQIITFSALELHTLAEGNHTLKVEVMDNIFEPIVQTIPFRVDKSPPQIGNAQFVSTDTSITISSIEAADSGVGLAETPFRYTIGSWSSPWMKDSYTINNLTPNSEYKVSIEARDQLGNVSSKNVLQFTKAQKPSITSTSPTPTTLGIQISDNNPANTTYQVKVDDLYVGPTGTLTTIPSAISAINKQILIQDLIPNSSYSVQIQAVSHEGIVTEWSSTISAATISLPPAYLSVLRSQTSVKIEWAAITGAGRYDIEVDGVVLSAGTATEFTHSNLAPESRHTYRLRVANPGGNSPWSNSITVFALPYPPEMPQNFSATATQTEIQLFWDSVAKAEEYIIEADGAIISIGGHAAFTHNGLGPETNHIYRVKAKNAGGDSAWTLPLTQRTLPYPPVTPEKVITQLSIHEVGISWEKVAGADGYEIEADGLIVDNGGNTSYVHDGLDALSGHTYRVRAKNAGGKSPWSSPLNVTTHPEIPAVPTNVMAAAEEKSIVLTWYQTSHAESYEVEIDGINIMEVVTNQFTHSELAANSRHSYRIRAKNISGNSDWSSPITLSSFPEGNEEGNTLTNIVAVVTNRMITLSWDAIALGARYEIEADGVLLDNGDKTIYHKSGLTANEFHTYKIRVKAEDGHNQWVAILSLSTLPDPPDFTGQLEAFATNNSIELRWEKMTGATSYDLEIDGKAVNVGDLSSYVHDKLVSGTGHVYRLRAKNVTGVTAWSNAIMKSTTSPIQTIIVKKDRHFDLSLIAYNVQDFSELTYVVRYNPDQVEVVDLYDYTPQPDLTASGLIPSSPLEVTHTAGTITFKVNQNVIPGTSWSGEITSIIFKSKIDGESAIETLVQ